MKVHKTPLYKSIGTRDSALCRIYAGIFLVPSVGYGERAHEFERYVCLEWVNVGGSGDESESLNFECWLF